MEAYRVSCEKNTRTKIQVRLILLSSCAVYGKRKSSFIKNQELH